MFLSIVSLVVDIDRSSAYQSQVGAYLDYCPSIISAQGSTDIHIANSNRIVQATPRFGQRNADYTCLLIKDGLKIYNGI